ncbi:ribonuclease HII [Virgibacillus halodenitrificans]|uniref:ribonuclease HII n=1 Tax=Virgibacillus halodenitrificans TaxID=1482 RepID=UPI002DBE2B4D|nr:ribonuclease HII [Virgibacillus halodenitrificans]MEC2160281.1 ribonuclease HII [Virgibacillus halodenitrificans]
MEKQSIKEIRNLFDTGEISEELFLALKNDERKGVQQLLTRFENKKRKERELEEAFLKMSTYENKCYKEGYQLIAGVDEAGRGPLAGPVVAAAVILPQEFKLPGLNDSKQLNESQRNSFYSIIIEKAISYGISIINSKQIDTINIFEATKTAMNEAINKLQPNADYVLIDAVELKGLSCLSESLIKGDTKSISIAAASVLAKVTRDRIMKDLHKEYPVYKFATNMGYGTKEHLASIDEFGITPYHRKSFAPIKDLI